jgi:hypothetical protein
LHPWRFARRLTSALFKSGLRRSDFRSSIFPHNSLSPPGHGPPKVQPISCDLGRRLLQAFDSEVVGNHDQPKLTVILNKPPFLPQFAQSRAELVNNPHLHSPIRTVIRTELSAWTCQPFCCQRTFLPNLSEGLDWVETCLAGLTQPHEAA